MLNQKCYILIQSFEHSNENVCACALVSFIHKLINLHIPYLCCKYQLISTFNLSFIDISILTNHIKMHVHVRACCRFSLSQCIDHYIIYLCCEYQLIWPYNEWFVIVFVLANQIQAHVHAHAGWHFLIHQSLDVDTIYQCCKYQLIWPYNEWFIGLLV